jgi:hypothetical protein
MTFNPRHLTLATALVGLVGVTTAVAQPPTHMGQAATDLVVLEGFFGQHAEFSLTCDFRRLPARDVREESLVPEGQRLVVTDVEWQALPTTMDGGAQFPAGTSVWARITLSTEPDGPSWRVFRSRTVNVETATAAVGTSEQLTTGFVVPPKTRICFHARRSASVTSGAGWTFLTDEPFGGNGSMGGVTLRGYFVKDN